MVYLHRYRENYFGGVWGSYRPCYSHVRAAARLSEDVAFLRVVNYTPPLLFLSLFSLRKTPPVRAARGQKTTAPNGTLPSNCATLSLLSDWPAVR